MQGSGAATSNPPMAMRAMAGEFRDRDKSTRALNAGTSARLDLSLESRPKLFPCLGCAVPASVMKLRRKLVGINCNITGAFVPVFLICQM